MVKLYSDQPNFIIKFLFLYFFSGLFKLLCYKLTEIKLWPNFPWLEILVIIDVITWYGVMVSCNKLVIRHEVIVKPSHVNISLRMQAR